MAAVNIHRGTWVVVCDSGKALILFNEGDARRLNLIKIDVISELHPPTHELGSDRPGRVYQSQGASRSAVEDTNWPLEAEHAFIKN